MTLVKICGITNLEDAHAAVAAGADALGFNFYTQSPRYIDPQAAREITAKLDDEVLTVGVFVNESSPDLVETIADTSGVKGLQLHGDETAAYCEALSDRFVIKVLRVSREFDPEEATRYPVSAIMLDAFDRELRGGTGRVVDWSIARAVRELVPRLILAGGLSPENVGDAVAAVNPFAVDACTALETSPGRKDHDRLYQFVRSVRAVKH